MNSPSFIHILYESDMNLEVAKKELLDFIPKIQSFIRTYVVGYQT